MTDGELDQFDVDKLIEKACKMNLPDLIQYCTDQSNWVDKSISENPFERGSQYTVRRYRDFVHGLLFLAKGYKAKPSTMRNEDFPKTKKIFESLVAKKQVAADWLSVYENWNG